MKSSPLHRYTAPRRTGRIASESPRHRAERLACKPVRTGGLRKRSAKQQNRQAQWNRITRNKVVAGITCELHIPGICTVRGTEGAHMLAKSQGGAWDEANHKLACRPCAHYATINPKWAAANGCALRRSTNDPIQKGRAA